MGLATAGWAQEDRDTLREKLKDNVAERWIYDDVDRGFAEAKRTGKPMLVVIRCVP
jgi:hypothetical protein